MLIVVGIAASMAIAGCGGSGSPQPAAAPPQASTAAVEGRQKAFASPEDAVVALIDACRTGDPASLAALFGVEAEVIAAGDPEQVGDDMQRLAAAYDREHLLVAEDDGSVTLWIGPKQWAFPAPIVKRAAGWEFDGVTGGEVTRARAMDDNEAAAARLLHEMADAQQRFRAMKLPGAAGTYAARLESSPGQRDGLWWDEAMGEPRSPLGVVADASAAGTIPEAKTDADRPGTYRGYRFRVLTSQGAAAPGGEKTYLDGQGRLTRGFAIVAWPDRYGIDGRSVFMVSADGRVFERDFGDAEGADATIPPVEAFDPTADWTPYPIER